MNYKVPTRVCFNTCLSAHFPVRSNRSYSCPGFSPATVCTRENIPGICPSPHLCRRVGTISHIARTSRPPALITCSFVTVSVHLSTAGGAGAEEGHETRRIFTLEAENSSKQGQMVVFALDGNILCVLLCLAAMQQLRGFVRAIMMSTRDPRIHH